MRTRLSPWIVAVALAITSASAVAAPQGSFRWITPMAGWGTFSNSLRYPDKDSLEDAPLGGLRIGCQLNEYWGFELAGSGAMTKEAAGPKRDVTYYNGSANFLYTPVNWNAGSLYLAAGGGASQRKAKGLDGRPFGTFEQAIGWMGWFNDHSGYRLEARNLLNVPKKNWGNADKADQQYFVGLTWAMGGKPVDTDGDGVPDRKDKCPNTPAGATVDATGCPHDADGDGVLDGIDQCPNTPRGARVDAHGCPTDGDGDGVPDGLDQCADTPRGATVDAHGCPHDSDGDGVWDGIDKCPNTPAGAKVDDNGCPIDSDGDGVPDGIDKCPNTPAGAKVDATGCPEVETQKETELLDTGRIRLQNVNFATGKADLLPESFPVLDEVGPILRKWSQLKIEIGGHTDSRGGVKVNRKLSDARAVSVRAYLLQHYPDISPDQLTSKGYGSSRPVAPNTTRANMAKNRRVEFVVLNKEVLKMEVEKRKAESK